MCFVFVCTTQNKLCLYIKLLSLMFLTFGFFLKFTSFIIVFFLPWSKMHVFLLFGVAFLHSWLSYIISHIHFYMSTHLVCICFDFFFSFCHVVETFFLLLLFRFFVVEKSFFFCNVLGNIIWHMTYLTPLSQGC